VRGAQPLLRYPDGTVQSAGTAFPASCRARPGGAGLPAALLAGHAAEDARGVAPIRLPAVTAAALAMRSADVVALRGFDPIYVNGFEDVDLCLRAVERDGGAFAVATDAVVVHDESRTPGRGRRIQENRRIFAGRFAGRLPRATTASSGGWGCGWRSSTSTPASSTRCRGRCWSGCRARRRGGR
jgi:GT2 family glycosyltransferase